MSKKVLIYNVSTKQQRQRLFLFDYNQFQFLFIKSGQVREVRVFAPTSDQSCSLLTIFLTLCLIEFCYLMAYICLGSRVHKVRTPYHCLAYIAHIVIGFSRARFASCSLLNIASECVLNVSANKLFKQTSYVLQTREMAIEQASQVPHEPVDWHWKFCAAHSVCTADAVCASVFVISVTFQFLKAGCDMVKSATHKLGRATTSLFTQFSQSSCWCALRNRSRLAKQLKETNSASEVRCLSRSDLKSLKCRSQISFCVIEDSGSIGSNQVLRVGCSASCLKQASWKSAGSSTPLISLTNCVL